MSQQYGPEGQGPRGPAGQGGQWPQRFEPQRKGTGRGQILAIIGGSLAVLLVAVGVVLLVTGRSEEVEPLAGPTPTAPAPTTKQASVPTPTQPVGAKGPNDVGVEIGKGIWFTPAKGWVPDEVKRAGASYVLPEPGRPQYIDGWFWARQTELLGAKDFAHQLVDTESNNLEHVVIRSGRSMKCASEAMRSCYAINYSAVVRNPGKEPVIFAGFVQAFEDKNGLTTATDSALEGQLWKQKYPQIQQMINSMMKSF
jgi:hypothetical protein